MIDIKKGKWYLVELRFGCSRVKEIAQCTTDQTGEGYYFKSYETEANRFLIFDYLVTEHGDILKEVTRPIAFEGFPEDEIIIIS